MNSEFLEIFARIAGGYNNQPEGLEALTMSLSGNGLEHDNAVGPAINNLASAVHDAGHQVKSGLDNIADAIRATIPAQSDTSHTPPADDSAPELTDRERRILEFVATHPGCSRRIIAAAVRGSHRDIHMALGDLVERGCLTREREGNACAFYPVPDSIQLPKGTHSLDFTNAEPPTDGVEWARQVRDRRAVKKDEN